VSHQVDRKLRCVDVWVVGVKKGGSISNAKLRRRYFVMGPRGDKVHRVNTKVRAIRTARRVLPKLALADVWTISDL